MTPSELAAVVAGTPWASLLPAHRSDDADRPSGPARLVEALPLGPGLWLAVVADGDDRLRAVPLLVDDDGGGTRRARPSDGAAEAALATLSPGSRRSGGFELVSWHTEPCAGERGFDVDQTNESVVVGDRAVVKWADRLVDSPAPDRLAALHAADFSAMPRPWGLLLWHPTDGSAPLLVASVVDYLPGAVDGWTWALDDLRTDVSTGSRLAVAGAERVGALVAGLHVALGAVPAEADARDHERWVRGAVDDLDRALAVTTGASHELLAAHEPAIRTRLHRLAEPVGATTIPVHGDLHVGQVLRAGPPGDPTYVVTDFDGSPVVPPAERRRSQSATADVAGMAQSLRHVGLVLCRHDPAADPSAVDAVTDQAVEAFLTAYTSTLALHDASHLHAPALLQAFRLQQVCREFTYAASHLPRWAYVPQAALPSLLSEGDTP